MTFFFHYNKQASQKAGRAVLTLHFKGKCYPVNEIKCNVPVETRERKIQPRLVVHGRANEILFGSDTENIRAIIV